MHVGDPPFSYFLGGYFLKMAMVVTNAVNVSFGT